MKGRRTDLEGDACAIARALHAVGDWWSLLIVRDALAGRRRFGEFQRSLGLAKNILAARLRKLVADGVMAAVPAADGGAHREYVLTPKGEALHVVVVALWQWGEAHAFASEPPARRMVDARDARPLPPLAVRAADGRALGPGEALSVPRAPALDGAERGA